MNKEICISAICIWCSCPLWVSVVPGSRIALWAGQILRGRHVLLNAGNSLVVKDLTVSEGDSGTSGSS